MNRITRAAGVAGVGIMTSALNGEALSAESSIEPGKCRSVRAVERVHVLGATITRLSHARPQEVPRPVGLAVVRSSVGGKGVILVAQPEQTPGQPTTEVSAWIAQDGAGRFDRIAVSDESEGTVVECGDNPLGTKWEPITGKVVHTSSGHVLDTRVAPTGKPDPDRARCIGESTLRQLEAITGAVINAQIAPNITDPTAGC